MIVSVAPGYCVPFQPAIKLLPVGLEVGHRRRSLNHAIKLQPPISFVTIQPQRLSDLKMGELTGAKQVEQACDLLSHIQAIAALVDATCGTGRHGQ